jgi:CDP-6-deoxy-D-xylo-4-hexulose-3-dehydrase
MVQNLSWKKWNKGDPHLINRIQWDGKEIDMLHKVLESDWFGYGPINEQFEKEFSKFIGVDHVNLTNSGSSAIQVAIESLMKLGRLKPGDYILHPITTFQTSISSASFLGLIPVFIETKPNTYVVDPKQVEDAIEKIPEIKGLILPHLLGNIPDMKRIIKALNGRVLIEDCCDTLGGYYEGKHVGSFGDYAAYSFYGSHHITTAGVGGAIATRDKEFAEISKSLIFWGRDFENSQGFLNRYTYLTQGTDSQMSAIQAAFGLGQIERLPRFIRERKIQFNEIDELFRKVDYFELPETVPGADPSWFAYPFIVKESAPFTREQFADYLAKNKVEVRPIMCGNILKQKPWKKAKYVQFNSTNPVADKIESNGMFIPCWGMSPEQKEDYYRILTEFFASAQPNFIQSSQIKITKLDPVEVVTTLGYALSGDFINAREKIREIIEKRAIHYTHLIKAIQTEIWNLPIGTELKVKLIEATGEVEFRVNNGSDQFIQLTSLLSSFVLAGLTTQKINQYSR